MNILLINPSLKKSSVSHYSQCLEKNRGVYPSLGLGYVASSLIDDGHIVFILDWDACFNPQNTLEGILKFFKPKIACFYAMTWTFEFCRQINHELKKYGITTIVGGPQVSSFPKETLEYGKFDYAVYGEGEHTIKELINTIEFNLNPYNVDGLVWKEGEQIIINKPREYEQNLDVFSFPAWHKMPLHNYYDVFTTNKKFATMIATRGCPYQCTFCDRINRMGSQWRHRSVNNVLEEIKLLKETYKIKEFMFFDDNFVVNKAWVYNFCDKVEPLKITWECRARVDSVDSQLLGAMKSAGCYRIRYGMESGSDKVLSVLKKGISVAQIRQCAEITRKSGIEIFAYFMLGNPYETPDQMQQTIDLAMEVDGDFTLFSKTILITGSELFDWAVREGIISQDYWLNYLVGLEKNPAPTIPNPYTDIYLKKANRQFYMRPSYAWKRLKKIKSFYQLKKQLSMARGLL